MPHTDDDVTDTPPLVGATTSRERSRIDLLIGATWVAAVFCIVRHGWTWPAALEIGLLTALCGAAFFMARRQSAALRASEERFGKMVEAGHEGFCLLDTGGRTTYVNERLTQMLGYSREEMLGRCLFDLMVPTKEGDKDQYVGLTSSEMRRAHDFQFRCKDGSTVWAQVSGSRIKGNSDEPLGALVVLMDITERLRLEERLRQASTLESIGTLSAGITHNFNNLLQGIVGYTHILVKEAQDAQIKRCGHRIRRFADRGTKLVQDLMAFSKKHRLKTESVDVNAVVEGLSDVLRQHLGEAVAFQFEPEADLHSAHADPRQIEEILLNLATNARDAMPGGGTFTITTANVSVGSDDDQPIGNAEPGPYVALTVSDTGTGMDEAALRHAFEPFYTTKEEGKGTGLGLSFVYGMVKQHGGYISADSQPSKGTTFHIYLPQATGSPGEEAEQGHSRPQRDTGDISDG